MPDRKRSEYYVPAKVRHRDDVMVQLNHFSWPSTVRIILPQTLVLKVWSPPRFGGPPVAMTTGRGLAWPTF